MEAISYQEKIDYYLEKNKVKITTGTDKERLRGLKSIIFNEKVNLDYFDQERAEKRIESDEYLKLLEKSRLNIYQSLGYIAIIEEVAKEERRAKRKAAFQRVKSIFRKK